MQVATHEEFARRLNESLRERLKSDSLVSGAVAPNRSPRFAQPHHQNRRVADIIAQSARTARKAFIEGRHDTAAFHFGVASHYALDNMVPHPPPGQDHTLCESRFADIDKEIEYPSVVQAGLGDGRAAERAINEMVWVATTTPLNFEQRLKVAHTCLLRLGYAVTEDPEPLDVIQELADAFVGLASETEAGLQRYREHAEAAAARLATEDGMPGLGLLGRLCMPAIRRNVRTRDDDRAPGAMSAALGRFGLRRFRRKLRAALEDGLGPQENARQLELRTRETADRYREVVTAVRERRMYWDWFNVNWGFWLEKGPLTLKLVRSEVRKAQDRLMHPAVEAFCTACAEQTAPQA
jgi:hypothetical protein